MKWLGFSMLVAVATTAAQAARAQDGGREGFVLELMAGGGSAEKHDAFERRLALFGFDPEDLALGNDRDIWRYLIALGRRVHEHVLLGAEFSNLDAARYTRQNPGEYVTQQFDWHAHAFGAFMQGDIGAGHHRMANLFVRVGGGLAYGSWSFDAIVSEAPNADANPAFDGTSPRTRKHRESFQGPYLCAAGGIAIMPTDYFGFGFEVRYVFAPALDNDLGDTHDLGGFALLWALRLRTWE